MKYTKFYFQCDVHKYGTDDYRRWQRHQHNNDTRSGSYACDHCDGRIYFENLPGNIAPRKKCKKCGRFTRIPALRLPVMTARQVRRYLSSHRATEL